MTLQQILWTQIQDEDLTLTVAERMVNSNRLLMEQQHGERNDCDGEERIDQFLSLSVEQRQQTF